MTIAPFITHIATADQVNHNGRVYSRQVLEYAVDKSKQPLMGVFDTTGMDLHNVCCIVSNLHFKGDQLLGTVTVMDSPKGKIHTALLAAQPPIDLSYGMAGIGEIRTLPDGVVEVYDFRLDYIIVFPTEMTNGK